MMFATSYWLIFVRNSRKIEISTLESYKMAAIFKMAATPPKWGRKIWPQAILVYLYPKGAKTTKISKWAVNGHGSVFLLHGEPHYIV